MSIQSEITRISGNVSDALGAVAAKGVTVPAGANSNDLADLISQIQQGDILYFTAQTVSKANGAQICRIPASGTDSAITADHILLEAVFANPGVIAGDVTWQTYAGYMTLTGTALAATTVSVALGKKVN